MLLLNQALPSHERPLGVAAIVAMSGVFSALAFTFAGLAFSGAVPLSAGAFLVGGGLEQAGPFAFLIYGAILALLGFALWRRWKGARRIAIAAAAAGIALAVPAISNAVADGRVFALLREGAQIVVRVLVIFYLSQEPVKEWFANHNLQLANAGRSDDTTRGDSRFDQSR
jgi:hypothetical protein